jgi:serpin B
MGTPRRSLSLLAALLLAIVGATVYAAASAGDGSHARAPARSSTTVAQDATVSYAPGPATAAFGLNLMRRLPSRNVVFSPDSVASALAMAGSGASGRTASQIAAALRVKSPAAFSALGVLQRKLLAEQTTPGAPTDQTPELDLANALFVQRGFSLKQPFVSTLASAFAAQPQEVDFEAAPATAAEAVNAWVSDHTQGLIKKIVGEMPVQTRLLLANAVYLKATWQAPFKQRATTNGTFHAPGAAVQTPLMHETMELPYARGTGYEAVALPYARSTLSLLLVLPRRGGVSSLLDRLTGTQLGAIAGQLHQRPVRVTVPRFHVTLDTSLNGPLQTLGITDAFDARADFSGITGSTPLVIGKVLHAADFAVDEQGTVAAASTIVTVEVTAEPGFTTPPVAFNADRPFLFFLRDDRTGTVLFAGRLSDPSDAG